MKIYQRWNQDPELSLLIVGHELTSLYQYSVIGSMKSQLVLVSSSLYCSHYVACAWGHQDKSLLLFIRTFAQNLQTSFLQLIIIEDSVN